MRKAHLSIHMAGKFVGNFGGQSREFTWGEFTEDGARRYLMTGQATLSPSISCESPVSSRIYSIWCLSPRNSSHGMVQGQSMQAQKKAFDNKIV